MQTMDGKKPQGVVASEMLALLDLDVLPTTLEKLLDVCGCEVGSAGHDELCKAYAESIGLPHLWPVIYYPFPDSLDNDSRHAYPRRALLQPRLSEQQAEALEAELLAAERRAIIQEVANDLVTRLRAGGAPLTASFAARAIEIGHLVEASTQPERQLALQRIEQRAGMSFRRYHMRRLMKDRPWLRILLPHQFMPLCKVAAEIHMTIEHRVDDVKGDLSGELWQLLCNVVQQEVLFDARRYQEMVLRAVEQRSNAAGKNAILGSIRKQRQCVRALAAPSDECVMLWKISKSGRKVVVALMAGSEGHYLPGRWC